MQLDECDNAILAVLRQQGRISNRDLAGRVGLSESACRERVRALERGGAILGYRAVLAPNLAGDRFEVWANISLAELTLPVVTALDELTRRSREVAASYTLAGAYDYVIRYTAASAARWDAFCAELEDIGVSRDRIKFGIVTEGRERTDWNDTRAAESKE